MTICGIDRERFRCGEEKRRNCSKLSRAKRASRKIPKLRVHPRQAHLFQADCCAICSRVRTSRAPAPPEPVGGSAFIHLLPAHVVSVRATRAQKHRWRDVEEGEKQKRIVMERSWRLSQASQSGRRVFLSVFLSLVSHSTYLRLPANSREQA